MKDIEIPLKEERGWRYRLFEIMPGAISWGTLLIPFVLSFISPMLAAYFIILFMLAWLVKATGFAIRVSRGYRKLRRFMRVNWQRYLNDLHDPKKTIAEFHENGNISEIDRWHYNNVAHYATFEEDERIHPNDVYHAVIVAAYNEGMEVLEPTVRSIVESYYDLSKIILYIAYEERGGPAMETVATELIKRYGKKFKHAAAVRHPKDLPNEVIGKGGNITYAGRQLADYVKRQKIDPLNVIVTTLDSDNRPHPHYFTNVTYMYIIDEERQFTSYQPIPMFLNNIWDAPAPMRVLATGTSFWNLIVSSRPETMRNFSSHAQSLRTLLDTDFWSVRTIVEDGHQYWRTYFRYEGRHRVVPIFIPIYQDAVLEHTYPKTLKAQFIQLRRWAYGASDVAYVATKGFFTKNRIPRLDVLSKLLRLLESHVSWATAPLILAGAAWLPIVINPEAQDNIIAHQLPRLASHINTLIAAGILVTVFISMQILPPRPPRYKAHRHIFMVLQWVLLPLSSIVYGSFAALYSQTRLMLGKYLDRFDVTTKVVKK